MRVRLPTFFIVGAAKSGTTSLYHYLNQHPAIFMSPIKEPGFFAPEVACCTAHARERFAADAASLRAYLDGPMDHQREYGIVLDWEDYLRLFANARAETALGEASVAYLSSDGAARRIRERVPQALIVMMLRNPADRLYSHYAAHRSGPSRRMAFGDWMRDQLRLESEEPIFGAIAVGRYGAQVRRYLDCFPRSQVRAYLYDEYVRDADAILRDMFAFVAVDTTVAVDTRGRHNVTQVPRWRALQRVRRRLRMPVLSAMSPTERAMAIDIYRDDIRSLAALIDRDLSGWLN